MKWANYVIVLGMLIGILASGHSVRLSPIPGLNEECWDYNPDTNEWVLDPECLYGDTGGWSGGSTTGTSSTTGSTATTGWGTSGSTATSGATTGTTASSGSTSTSGTTGIGTSSGSSGTTDGSTAGFSGGESGGTTGDDESTTGNGRFLVKAITYLKSSAVLDYVANYYGGSGSQLLPRGYVRSGSTGIAYPVVHAVGENYPVKVHYEFAINAAEGRSKYYTLSTARWFSMYQKENLLARGTDLFVEIDSLTSPLSSVGVKTGYNSLGSPLNLGWVCSGEVGTFRDRLPGVQQLSPLGQLYLTLKPPLVDSTYTPLTRKRVEWVFGAAESASNTEEISDNIWESLTDFAEANLTFDMMATNKWRLDAALPWKILDKTIKGDCDDHAALMRLCLGIEGIPANVEFICASTDYENVLEMEEKLMTQPDGTLRKAWLVMDFNPTGVPSWNAYEGVCHVSAEDYDYWYAVTPSYSSPSSYEMFMEIPFAQKWVYTINNVTPANESWVVSTTIETIEKPVRP